MSHPQTYRVVESNDLEALEIEVSGLIDNGYPPLGGLIVYNVTLDDGTQEPHFAQALSLKQ